MEIKVQGMDTSTALVKVLGGGASAVEFEVLGKGARALEVEVITGIVLGECKPRGGHFHYVSPLFGLKALSDSLF